MIERPLTADALESLAQKAGLSMAEVCRRAQVATSTFFRWKGGKSGLTMESYVRLLDAIDGVTTSTKPETK